MSGDRRLERRAFVVRALMLAAAGALGPPLAGCGGGREITAAELAAWLPHEDAVVRLGREYLGSHPGEARPATLLALLVADAGRLEDAAARQRMLTQIRADYGEGRTAILSGWVLSVSEARLCALAALAAEGPTSGS